MNTLAVQHLWTNSNFSQGGQSGEYIKVHTIPRAINLEEKLTWNQKS